METAFGSGLVERLRELVPTIIHYFFTFENHEIINLVDSSNPKNIIKVKDYFLLTKVKYYVI